MVVPRGRTEAWRSPEGTPGMTRLILLDYGRAGGSMTPNPRFSAEMISSLRDGGAVIFPTDTLYGLGVDPCSETGLNRLLAAKRAGPGETDPAAPVRKWNRSTAGRGMFRPPPSASWTGSGPVP